jgi:tRNA(Ile)-lysidine synthase
VAIGALPPGTGPDAVLASVRARLASSATGSVALLACSGGPDSIALAVLARAARPDLLLVLAHVTHGLRTPADDQREGEAVASLALRLGVEHVVLPVTVSRTGRGIESDARDARHSALEAEAFRRGAAAVLLAHHAEDQAETVLLRLVRGTGTDGLAGMTHHAGPRCRPLLNIRRDDVHAAAHAIDPDVMRHATHDPMNDDPSFARVRLRRDVLPVLADLGPDPVGALTRTAALARDEVEVLEAAVDALVALSPIVRVGPVHAIASDVLRDAPVALTRRLLRRLLGPIDAASVERFLHAPDGWRATLPGPLDASIERGWHLVRPARPLDPRELAHAMLLPGRFGSVELHHPASSLRLHAVLIGAGDDARLELGVVGDGVLPPGLASTRRAVRLRAVGALTGPLTVRTRRPGDRIRLAGGTRTIADVMGEAGVPRVVRDLLPVVTDRDGLPRWVPGLAVDVTVHDPSA